MSDRHSKDLEPIVVSPHGAQKMLACGRTRIYELIAAEEVESYKDGRRRKITVASIESYVARRLSTGSSEGRIK